MKIVFLCFRLNMDEAKRPKLDDSVILEPIPVDDSDAATEDHRGIPVSDGNAAEQTSSAEQVNGANEMDGVEQPNVADKSMEQANETEQPDRAEPLNEVEQANRTETSNEVEQANGVKPLNEAINEEIDSASDDDTNDNNTTSFLSLNEDCFGEIFDWLSSSEVKSIGATCKKLNQLTSAHFSRKYPAKRLKIHTPLQYKRPGIVPHPPDFLKLYRTVYLHDADRDIFTFMAQHCKKTLDKIQFGQNTVRKRITNGFGLYIKEQLVDVASIEFIGCRIDGELHHLILQYCVNLKQLSIRIYTHEGTHVIINCSVFVAILLKLFFVTYSILFRSFLIRSMFYSQIGTDDSWLQKKYPHLEHLALVKSSSKIDQLKRFFEKNSNVTSFTTSLSIAMANRPVLRTVKLDDLGIEIALDDQERLEKFVCFINKLHENGVFKRLKLRITDSSVLIEHIDEISKINGLVGIYFDCDVKISEVLVEALTTLNKLDTMYIRQPIFEDTDKGFLWKGAINVRQLFIQRMKCGDFATEILAFIQHSSKIRKIHIRTLNGTDFELNLAKARKERNKLRFPRKVNVLVDEASYLHIKWNNEDTVLDSLEVKRSEADLTKHPFILHDEY